MKITQEWLEQQSACEEGRRAVAQQFPDGADLVELAEWLERVHPSWWRWLMARLGATHAVEVQCSRARFERLFADASRADKASSGNSSTAASSGNSSKAAAEGENTIAMVAGRDGIVQAGERGCFAAVWRDADGRNRIAVGYVAEDGIKADTAYRLDEVGRFVEAECP